MKRPTPKGQTLVLFALTLLLLTLMVFMTLSIGMKAKEKMELETAADAAAYSQAVATARAFNNISLMNRALMSHMVAMTGVESLISWSSHYRSALNIADKHYKDANDHFQRINTANCPCAPTNAMCARLCQCSGQAMSDIAQTQSSLQPEIKRIKALFDSLDKQAGDEARSLQLGSIHDDQLKIYGRLRDNVVASDTPEIATKIAEQVTAGGYFQGEVTALGAPKEVNGAELGGNCGGSGAACERRDAGKKDHFIHAAMGTRGHAFLTSRANGKDLIRGKLGQIIPPMEITALEDEGSGYFASSVTHSSSNVSGGALYADDHGEVGIFFARTQPPCPPPMPTNENAEAIVRSDDRMQDNDVHTWWGGSDSDAPGTHTLGDCTRCPGMWPPHMDYNSATVADANIAFGQPKNYAILQRDYGSRPAGQMDPWNLFFRFRFFNKSGTEFDNRGIRLSTTGEDISRAVALSTGIAYYRRVGGWTEPPNFLNPYWRATLVPANIDTADIADIEKALGATGSPFAKEVATALDKQGYEAW